MSDPRALLLLLFLVLLAPACAKPTDTPPPKAEPQPELAIEEDVPPPAEVDPSEIDDTELAPPETRAPGSLNCLASGSVEEEFRVPVTATYDPNSDFAHFSLDSVGETPQRCSLVITRWSGLPESGTYERVFTRDQLAEGAEDAQVFFVFESGDKRWVADELTLKLTMAADTVTGEFSGTLVEPGGSLLQVSNGLFTAPLRRLAELPPESDPAEAESEESTP